jgi:hypothetical protein
MKTLPAFLGLVFAASVAHAQVSPAVKPADSKSAPAKPAAVTPAAEKPVDPKAKVAPAKKEVKKPAPIPTIPGMELTRPNGNKLGLEIVGGQFKLTFYDKKNKPMAMDVSRAAARWDSKTPFGDNRTILNGGGSTLVGSKPVTPPYVFNVFLTLLQGEGDDAQAVEDYVVPFRG